MDRLSDYDYDLPEGLIAQEPLADRAASRLLVLRRGTGEIEHRLFRDVADLLMPGDLLVMNDTRVTALRLLGRKPTGGEVEALLLKERQENEYIALVKPGRRLHKGARIEFGEGLAATVVEELPDGPRVLRFDGLSDIRSRLERIGSVPLPPYIHTRLQDPERYQTVFAATPGSAAAPTAGLHFTPEILAQLRQRGIDTATVTLDVGLDTFRPVQAENLDEHRMHGEVCTMPEQTANAIRSAAGRVVAVGTTAVRTIESFSTGPREVESGSKVTDLFIRPGYRFRAVDAMFTNFHLPRTTMLLMISALAGYENVRLAYSEAIQHKYRFLSFGDSMLIL